MGRPINYKKLGGDPAQDGEQFVFTAWFDGEVGPEAAFLVKQVATRRFRLAAVADATRIGLFDLSDTAIEGETAILEVRPFAEVETFSITEVTVDSVTDVIADGSYNVTLAGGDPISAATITFVADTGVYTITLVDGGEYPTDLSGATISATVAGETVEFEVTTVSNAIVESANKVKQHRVITNEGGAYKYDVNEAASGEGEADIKTQ
jgi:hypothetical protein